MSLLGKILAVLNVLAALAFLYFAAVDYGKRQHWTHAILRHDLKLKGLPLNPEDTDREGNLLVRELDPTILNDLFAGAGSPVETQVKALRQAQEELQRKIDGTNAITVSNPLDLTQKLEVQTKTQRLAWALRPLVTTAGRREELDQLMTAKDKDQADRLQNLQNELTMKFEDARGKLEPGEKRRAIAHLLFSLAELAADEATEPGKDRDLINNPAYKRALAVVGLEAAVREMDDQAQELDKMAQAIRSGMGRDRDRFVRQHASLLVTLLDAAADLQDRRNELQREKERAEAQQTVVNTAKKRVADLEVILAERQKATEALLKQQAKMEQTLFKAQQEFRDAAGENHKLEQEIRTLEKGR